MKAAAVLGALVLALTVFLYPVKVHAASPIQKSSVRILDADRKARATFSLTNGNAVGGYSVATGDLGDDGVPEIVLGSGLGNAPDVILLRQDGTEITRFPAYAANAKMGVNVAVCDVNGDGKMDIVTSAQRGGGPHVRAFDASGVPTASFFAYDASDRNGVNIACGDLDGDGKAELITLPAAGAQPLARVWEWSDGAFHKTEEFLTLDAGDLRGTVGVVENGELTIASQQGGSVRVRTFAFPNPVASLSDRTTELDISGVNAITILNGTIVLAPASDGKILDMQGNVIATIKNATFGGLNVAAADLDGDGVQELVVADAKPAFGKDGGPKSIVVDVSDQRLYAYEHGILVSSFLISTAANGYVTPRGNHVILAKVPIVNYSGPTWNLGLIPYNLRFENHIYIHYAPWNHSFGTVQSHGCVNVDLENIKWIYGWADVGDSVVVQD